MCVPVIGMDREGNTCQKQPNKHRVTIVPSHDELHRARSLSLSRHPFSSLSISVCLSLHLSVSPSLPLTGFWVKGSPSRRAHAPFNVRSASILVNKAFRQRRLKIKIQKPSRLRQCNASRCSFIENELCVFLSSKNIGTPQYGGQLLICR